MPAAALPFRNVSWKVLTGCNYRCTYCLQPSFADGYPADIVGTVALVSDALGEPYEVKIAGGELFAAPRKATALAAELAKRGHWLSVCTNLSASADTYARFIEATRGQFYAFQASLHLEYADPESFLQKCLAVRAHLPASARLVVNNVVQQNLENIRHLAVLQERFRGEGFVFYTDLLVDERGVYQRYEADQESAIRELLGEEERLFLSRGRRCRAGHSYFVLLPDLEAWRCWDGYLREDRSMYLGNVRKGTFRLPGQSLLCPYDTCSCPTPLIKHRSKLATSEQAAE